MKYGVGIDVSKGKSTVAIISVVGEVIEEPFEITHDLYGLKLLEEKIKDIPKEDLKIVMEETGTYHLPVFSYLIDKGYFVIAENALNNVSSNEDLLLVNSSFGADALPLNYNGGSCETSSSMMVSDIGRNVTDETSILSTSIEYLTVIIEA